MRRPSQDAEARPFPLTPTPIHVPDKVLGTSSGAWADPLARGRRQPGPVPLICTHGWPWTCWHWAKVIDPLADPGAHGGDPAEAFEVIVPSLPGFGFSTPLPDHPDMNFWKVADLWHTLMTRILGGHRNPQVSAI